MNNTVRKIIGLTGGIGSGKTTVAQILKAHAIPVIDLDALGRAITDGDPKIQQRLVEILGESVFPDHHFDKRKAREVLFSDREKRQAVEKYLHPIIWERFQMEARDEFAKGLRLVVCEAALLLETGLVQKMDALILVTAPEEVRRNRVMERDQIPAVLVNQMIQAQLRDQHPETRNCSVISNSGSLGHLTLQVENLIGNWRTHGWID